MIKISKISPQQNSIFIFWKSANFFVCFCLTMYSVYTEKMFTIEIVGREAHWRTSYIHFTFLSVCLYLINVKTAELIGFKFCVVTHMTPEKVNEWSKFQKLAPNKIRFSFFENPQTFLFVFVLQCIVYTKRKCSHLKKKNGEPSTVIIVHKWYDMIRWWYRTVFYLIVVFFFTEYCRKINLVYS